MKKPVYLDYNATTPIDPEVAAVMLPFINNNFGNPSSSYSIGRNNKEAIEKARIQVAGLIRCHPGEIFFTSGGTESNNHAITGAAFANQKTGRHIIASSIEHPAVINVCRWLETSGFIVSYIGTDKYGAVNPDDIEKAIRPDTTLVTVMHANNEIGTIQPINDIAAITKRNNILFHTDAAQSAGKINTDVSSGGIDLLTLAGHKLYAPKGIGVLYIREGVKIRNLMLGGDQERGVRPGTENVIHIVALGKACEIAMRDLERNHKNMLSTKELLFSGLRDKLGGRVKVNGNHTDTLPNTLSLAFDNVGAHTLASIISQDVLISTGAACHSDSTEISAVLKAIGTDLKTAASTVRVSTGRFTTSEEIEHAVEVLSSAVLKLS